MTRQTRFGLTVLLLAALGAGCATTLEGRSEPRGRRGQVVVSGNGMRLVVEGPLMLRAYAASPGGSVFLARAAERSDADCFAPAGDADRHSLTRDRVSVIHVPAGMVACVAAGRDRDIELLWKARPVSSFLAIESP